MAAWLILIGLVVVTVAPIGLRPHTMLSAQGERFIGFALAGGLLALAYPRRPFLVALLVLGLAVGLEVAQFVAATRHPGVRDMLAKLAGGAFGLGTGWLVNRAVDMLRRRRET